MPTIERVLEDTVLGEGPHWDISSQSLYFVDIFGKSIVKYTPAINKVSKVSVDRQPSFIIPIQGRRDEFVVSLHNELAVIRWDDGSDKIIIKQKLCAVEAPKKFNDAKCDSSGRLWTGDHVVNVNDFDNSPALGTLYSLDSNLQFKSHVEGIRCTNGLTFNDKTRKMFYIDSFIGTIDVFDFEINSGTISNRQVWFTLKNANIPGLADGMTIDTDGNLWVAVFGGSRVLKIDGNKAETLLETVEMPVDQVTSIAFGGENLDELFVTTGSMSWDGKERPPPENGATYKVTGLRVKGLPGVNFKIN